MVDGGTTGRHTSARLNRYINQAIQRFFYKVAKTTGGDASLRTGLLTMSTSQTRDATGWAPYMYVPQPTLFHSLIGFDVYDTAGRARSLQQYERAERNMFRDSPFWWSGGVNGVGPPSFYRIGGSNQAGTQLIGIIPFTDAAYQYELIYVPILPDLVGDSDTFDGISGYEEYVINMAAMNVLTNDGQAGSNLYQLIKQDRDEMEAHFEFELATIGGPGRRLDTEEQRERLLVSSRWRYP